MLISPIIWQILACLLCYCVLYLCSGLLLWSCGESYTELYWMLFLLKWVGGKLGDSSPTPQVWDISQVLWQWVLESANYSFSVAVKQQRKLQFILNWILNISNQFTKQKYFDRIYTKGMFHLKFPEAVVSVENIFWPKICC